MANRTLATALALALALALSAAALAAAPLHGKSYQGKTSAAGVDGEGHKLPHLTARALTLKVSSNGKTVTVHFSSSVPPLYDCRSSKTVRGQSTKPAKIASDGTFSATVDERFTPGPGLASIVEIVTGRFSGGSVSGKVRTVQPPECTGSATFSAKA